MRRPVRPFLRRGREGSQLVEGLVNWLTSFEETLPISADKETPINVGTYVCALRYLGHAVEKPGLQMAEESMTWALLLASNMSNVRRR